jgi:hypothetical protein
MDALAPLHSSAAYGSDNRLTNESCLLPFPDDLVNALGQPRSVRVYEHWVPVNPEWWNNELTLRDLPGGPMRVSYDSGHRAGNSRCALFKLAAMNPSSDGILRLLWHTLAWGGGRKARLMNRRLDKVASNPEFAVSALRAAAAAARGEPR